MKRSLGRLGRLGWTFPLIFFLTSGLCPLTPLFADTHFVDIACTNPVVPYTNWTTAATVIQDAIAQAVSNDTVLVADGVYKTGGGLTNYPAGSRLPVRVVINKAITLKSMNGPTFASIEGVGPNGSSAVRCVYMADGATLCGFTVTNGHTLISGDDQKEKSGGGVWCQSASATVSNCILYGNSAKECGAGGYRGLYLGCMFSENLANEEGGGVYGGVLWNCTLCRNASTLGGGAARSVLYSSVLRDNEVSYMSANLILGHQAGGGGASDCVLSNCTVVGNSASGFDAWAGGVQWGTNVNCIIYHNQAPSSPNWGANPGQMTIQYSCTYPWPVGIGNMTNDPAIAALNNPRLLAGSPCLDKGVDASWMAEAVDMDGEGRKNGVIDIGADEFWQGGMTGKLQAAISASYTQSVAGFCLPFEALIEGAVSGYKWDFGDGWIMTNRFRVEHVYTNEGAYEVTVTVTNQSTATVARITILVGPLHEYFVSPTGNDGLAGTNWLTAKATLQAAVDVAGAGDRIIVTNGLYSTGGGLTNYPAGSFLPVRVAVNKPITVQSVNGPEWTVIEGSGPDGDSAMRCVYLSDGAFLSGFTVTNGHSLTNGITEKEQSGGGIWCESLNATVSNCICIGNSAKKYGGGIYMGTIRDSRLENNSVWGVASCGGGAYQSSIMACDVISNSAKEYGGGAYQGAAEESVFRNNTAGNCGGGVAGAELSGCTVVSNSVSGETSWGGGVYQCVLSGSVVRDNISSYVGGGAAESTLNNCLVHGNVAAAIGGGGVVCSFYNCTVSANSASIHSGGGYWCVLGSSIVYFNNAPLYPDWYNASGTLAMDYSCTTPLPAGTGNITNDPQFMNITLGDYRLKPSSACIEKGLNEAWVYTSTDLAGNPRVVNGTMDMGAYEFYFAGNVKALLQGPYDAASNMMRTALGANVPLKSPYAADPKSRSTMLSNEVDWALLQVRETPTNAPTVSKSVLLRNDGTMVDVSGSVTILLEVPPMSTNYLVVSHRNHLSVMTSQPLAFTNQLITYDFSTNWTACYGGSNGCVELKPGVWGMMAGDADGDGKITETDRKIVEQQKGRTGYLPGDLDLNGVVE